MSFTPLFGLRCNIFDSISMADTFDKCMMSTVGQICVFGVTTPGKRHDETFVQIQIELVTGAPII